MNNSSVGGLEDLPECSRMVSTMLTAAISLVSITAFVGNILVIITFVMSTTLKTSTNYFIVNMAVSDALSSLTGWLLYATEGMLFRKPMINGSMATFVCKLGHYSRAISQAVSVLSLLLIVVDRYIAIVLPFKSILVTKRLRSALLILTWIFPALLFFAPYAWSSNIIQERHQTFCRSFVSWSKMAQFFFYSLIFLIFYHVPLISIIILYSRIMKCIRQSRPGEEEEENIRMRNLHQNKIVMKVFVWIVSAFFICWTPLWVYVTLKKIFPASLFVKDSCMIVVGLLFYIFPTLGPVINPVILFVSSSRFFRALKEMFSCFTCKPCQCSKSGRVSAQRDIVGMQVIR